MGMQICARMPMCAFGLRWGAPHLHTQQIIYLGVACWKPHSSCFAYAHSMLADLAMWLVKHHAPFNPLPDSLLPLDCPHTARAINRLHRMFVDLAMQLFQHATETTLLMNACRMLADLAMWLLQRSALELLLMPWGETDELAAGTSLPPPMHKGTDAAQLGTKR